MQNQQENKHTWEGTAGTPSQEPPSPQKLRCFRDILGIVLSLSDEERRTLTSDVPNEGTKLQFACLCTKIITSVCKSAIQSYLPTLICMLGMEAVLRAEEKLEKKAESASMSSSTSTAPSPKHSAESSHVDPSDLICIIVEEFVREVKMAMLRAICKVASCEASSSCSKDWKTECSRVVEEMFNILETKVDPEHDQTSEHHSLESLLSAQLQSEAPKQKTDIPSASQSIYRGVREEVWGFLLGLQKPFPDKRRIFPQVQPPMGADLLNDLLLGDQRTDSSVTATESKRSVLGITSHHSMFSVGSKTAPLERNTDREVGAVFETLTGSQSKMENPSSLLVKSEHSERNHDSVLDVKPVGESPTASSAACTPMAEETLEILSVSRQEYETYTSSCSPENESRSMDPAPVALKKSSRRIRFVVPKKAPIINIRIKKSRKICPAGLVSDSHQSPSTSGNLQEFSDRDSKVSLTPFKKTRQGLSRIFSAISKALPNPFQCMTSPS